MIYFLKNKTELFAKFKEWKALVETQTSRKIKRFRTDNGLEFCSEEFDRFCKKNGIDMHKTIRGTPQQNELAERMNRTVMERVKCLLSNVDCSAYFWDEAVMTFAYLINRSPSTTIRTKTQEEMWSGHPLCLENLKVFEYVAYAHINQGKLKRRALECMFLGYPQGIKGFRLWCMEKGYPRV